MSTPEPIVIVGGGQAGAWAARTLREQGHAGPIHFVSEEIHPPYERPALSKDVLAGRAPPSSLQLFSTERLSGLDLRWHRGTRAVALDRQLRRVVLDDGAALPYDKVILCMGGRALRPPIVGIDLPGVFTLRTLDDSQRLARALAAAQRICVIGGGWIGLEVASTARALSKAVTVLEKASRLCERVLPAGLAEHLALLHKRAGVDVRANTGAEAIERTSSGLRVIATNGEAVHTDVVVVGAGLLANDEIAREAGLHCQRGILVNDRCETSDPDILAAGDVAVAPNEWAGAPVRIESWQNATDQGIAAARSALGEAVQHNPLPWFWSDQHGVNIQIYGWPAGHHRLVTRVLAGTDSTLAFLLDNNRVASAVAFNAPKDLRLARKLIELKKPVRDSDLADPQFPLSRA